MSIEDNDINDAEENTEGNEGRLNLSVRAEGDYVVITVSGIGDDDIDIFMGCQEAKEFGVMVVGIAELVNMNIQKG